MSISQQKACCFNDLHLGADPWEYGNGTCAREYNLFLYLESKGFGNSIIDNVFHAATRIHVDFFADGDTTSCTIIEDHGTYTFDT